MKAEGSIKEDIYCSLDQYAFVNNANESELTGLSHNTMASITIIRAGAMCVLCCLCRRICTNKCVGYVWRDESKNAWMLWTTQLRVL